MITLDPTYFMICLGMLVTVAFVPSRRTFRLGLWGFVLVVQTFLLPYVDVYDVPVAAYVLYAAFGLDVLDAIITLFRYDD